jgi:amino acid transporter
MTHSSYGPPRLPPLMSASGARLESIAARKISRFPKSFWNLARIANLISLNWRFSTALLKECSLIKRFRISSVLSLFHISGCSRGAGKGSCKSSRMADTGEEKPLLPRRRQRNVTVLSLVAITYFAVAGGPEGTETLIQAAGPLYSVIGFAVVGVLWSVPMALMSAELTTAFPENGGYVLWVSAAFGAQTGEMAGWLQFVSSGVDACIYPGLFLVYLEQAVDVDLSDPTTAWSIKITFVVLLLLLNVMGIESVGHGSTLFMIALLSPFVVIIAIAFTGIFTGTTVTGWAFSTSDMVGTPASEPDWPAFLMVLLWNMGYWEGASVCAGEVANVGSVFPLAIAISMVIVLLNYVLPILAFSGLDGDYASFDNGHYITVARQVCGPYYAYALGLAQTISVCGLFANGVVKNTYLVCGMSEQGMLPSVFAGESLPCNALGLGPRVQRPALSA